LFVGAIAIESGHEQSEERYRRAQASRSWYVDRTPKMRWSSCSMSCAAGDCGGQGVCGWLLEAM